MLIQHRSLLYESMLFRLLAAAYTYPDEDLRGALDSGAFAMALDAGVSALGDPLLKERAMEVYDAIVELGASDTDLAQEYSALFLRKVPCSPYGSRYQTPAALYRARVLSEVAGYYRALGLRPALDRPDLPDHIGAEVEFLGVVAAREQAARDVGDDTESERLRDLGERFGREQVGEWIAMFRARLAKHARLRFYPAVTDLVIALLEHQSPGITAPVRPGAMHHDEGDQNDRSASSFDCGPVAG
jgi:TorA maturation chaperone TorD